MDNRCVIAALENCGRPSYAAYACVLQYLYNLEVYGHKQYSRRDKSDLEAAQVAVEARVASGELGPLSPLE